MAQVHYRDHSLSFVCPSNRLSVCVLSTILLQNYIMGFWWNLVGKARYKGCCYFARSFKAWINGVQKYVAEGSYFTKNL